MEFEEDDGGDGGIFESVTGFCKELLVAELDELDATSLVDELVNDAEYVGRKYVDVAISEIGKRRNLLLDC